MRRHIKFGIKYRITDVGDYDISFAFLKKRGDNNTNDPQKKYHLGTVSKNILLEGLNQFHSANLKSQE